jgi:ribosomal-protein-alanine N-acetyltransferase
MGSSGFIVETQRLLLRQFTIEDAGEMFRLNSDPDVIRHTGDVPFYDSEEARNFIKNYKAYQSAGYGRMSILLKGSGAYLGWCGLNLDMETGETDIGFRLLKAEWGKGYATEAASACLQKGFDDHGLKKVIGRAMEQNIKSIKVLKNLGMKFERAFEAHGGRCVQYAISKQ